MAKRWYVVHTQTGLEERVRVGLEARIRYVQAPAPVVSGSGGVVAAGNGEREGSSTGEVDEVGEAVQSERLVADDSPITQVLIPTERVSEIRDGKKKISERKFFPGYVLIKMELNDETWHLVKNTPGVTGFIGAGRRPVPLSEEEVADILKQTEEKAEKPIPKVVFERGENVRVTEGPFTNFSGTIEEVNPDRGKLKVTVSIFGRATPVELEYWQVERL